MTCRHCLKASAHLQSLCVPLRIRETPAASVVIAGATGADPLELGAPKPESSLVAEWG